MQARACASFQVWGVCTQYDSLTGEVVGVFESLQPSDTDMGSKAPKEVRIEGIWYGQLA